MYLYLNWSSLYKIVDCEFTEIYSILFILNFFFLIFFFFFCIYFFIFEMNFYLVFFTWIPNSVFSFIFFFDFFSFLFLFFSFVVFFNAFFFIYIYIYKYINMLSFTIFTFSFILSMIFLCFSFNVWTLILGWEGLGITSFYLIFFYNTFISWNSSIKTFINNKIGDIFLLISFIFIRIFFKESFGFFFLLSLITKTAQYPFICWLPLAMAAPTPISSIVHSSTLVTAGLFVIFRFSDFYVCFLNNYFFLNLVIFSILLSSLKACIEKDLKKVIALSTLSQMSFIIFFMIFDLKTISFFYLCNHAVFKSLMFISIGFYIIFNFFNQFSMLKSFFSNLILVNLCFKISCFNLSGLTFFSCFFIKEIFSNYIFIYSCSNIIYLFSLFNIFLTLCYRFKIIFFNFNINFNSKTFVFIYNYFFIYFFSTFVSLFISKFLIFMEICIFLPEFLFSYWFYIFIIFFCVNFINLANFILYFINYTDFLFYNFSLGYLNSNFMLLEIQFEFIFPIFFVLKFSFFSKLVLKIIVLFFFIYIICFFFSKFKLF